MTTQINRLALKALMLDTIMVIKHGSHLAPNYKHMKNVVCDVTGVSRRCTSKTLLQAIKSIYEQAGLIDEYNKTAERMGV
jgi:hypothetical protein